MRPPTGEGGWADFWADFSAGYRAGQLAMRERAAKLTQENHSLVAGHQEHGFSECLLAIAIRALEPEEPT